MAAAREAVRVHKGVVGASKHIIGVELSVASPDQLGFAIQSCLEEPGT